MSRATGLQIPFELAFEHRVLFGVELLDAVTLERVYQGINVVAVGLKNRPYLNDGGLFVWRPEDASNLQRITIDPGLRPFELIEISAADMQGLPPERPLKTQELSPTISYPFASGTTGITGRLIEAAVADPTPVVGAAVFLQWQGDDSDWHDAPTISHTNINGDFAAVLRLLPTDVPTRVPNSNDISVRLGFSIGANHRHSNDEKIPIGRMTRPTPSKKLIFAWQDLTP